MHKSDLIDFGAVAKLQGLLFRSDRPRKGHGTGIHKSTRKGASPDFFEYKEYSPGDESKHIDWRLFGRLDRLYVKKFEDEVGINWCILVDRSGSMRYRSEGESKLGFALRLSSTFAYLLLKQGDSVVMGSFCEGGLKLYPTAASISRLLSTVDALCSETTAKEKSGFWEPVSTALQDVKGGAAFVLVSDFLSDLNSIERAVKLVRSAKRELIAVHVLDPEELRFSFEGPIEFHDMEDDFKVSVTAEEVREVYRERFRLHREALVDIFRKNGVPYVLSLTNNPIEEALLEVAGK